MSNRRIALAVAVTVVTSPMLGAYVMPDLNYAERCGMFDTCAVDTTNVEVRP
jgi:hypothetical protein